MRSTMERLRIWDFRTQRHTPTDRNLSLAFNELDTLKDKLGLPDAVFEKAAYIYRKAQQRGLVRGRTILSVLAAAVYIACREMGISKTLKDIVAVSNIRLKQISKSYRKGNICWKRSYGTCSNCSLCIIFEDWRKNN